MFNNRKYFHNMMDEVDRILDQMESEFEEVVRYMFDSKELPTRSFVYGFALEPGPSGNPIIKTFGDKGTQGEIYREPLCEQIVDPERSELKLILELPGIEREDIDLNVLENSVSIEAARGDRKYRVDTQLKQPVEPSTASAKYRSGVLEVSFRMKGKANKGFTRIKVD